MAGAFTARRVDALIAGHGMPSTLARAGEATTIALYAKRYGSVEADTGNTAAQQEFKVRIGTAALVASAWADKAPRRFDTLAVDGKARKVLNVDTREDAGVAVMHILTVVG